MLFSGILPTILGNRRFSLLSPTLIRLEYSPDGRFEDRRSMVAAMERKPLPFPRVTRDGPWDVLDTGTLEIRTKDNGGPFNRLNLEIRWKDRKFLQFWRPGDRDYQNLGGTLRSLDRYSGAACQLDGVHPAGMESPDTVAMTWVAWNQDEVEPLYTDLHPAPPAKGPNGAWMQEAPCDERGAFHPARSFNIYREARKFGPGILSRSGYFFLNDSESAVLDAENFPIERNRPGTQDWYFFAYGPDYKRALADFRLLTGPAPLPPRKALGIVFSRWPAFRQEEIEDIASAFSENGYPLSTLVMDMEWHKEGWGHWEFDPSLIPDPKRFFERCRELDIDVTFNDHPLDVREDDIHFEEYLRNAGPDVLIREREYKGKTLRMAAVDICDKTQNQAFRKACHRGIWDLGLSYWWNDGSRGQLCGTAGQLISNKTFFEDSAREGRRPMHLARYGGLGSHRYGAFFTGDANSDYDVLRLQCEFNTRAAGVGLSLISHDIGGFALDSAEVISNKKGTPIIDPVRYLRWLQFGVFNPMLRFHSAPGCGSRRPDDYDEELEGACRHWLRIRHSLLPYIYTSLYEGYRTGIPLTRGLFVEHPDDPEAYRFDEYYFGPSLLVAPVFSANGQREVYLPPTSRPGDGKGDWWVFESCRRESGGARIRGTWEPAEFPVYVPAGTILPRQSPDAALHAGPVEDLVLDVYPGANGRAVLFEDDGVSETYLKGEFSETEFVLTQEERMLQVSGRVITGQPGNLRRSLCLDLSSLLPPKSVRDGTNSVLPWECLESRGRYRIRLDHLRQGDWNVSITF